MRLINEAQPATVRSLKRFGMKIGAAYQIYDDCLDIAGNESPSAKRSEPICAKEN